MLTADQAQQLIDLEEASDGLSLKDKSFALDLIVKGRKYAHLSEKQWFWVGKLLRRALLGPEEPSVPKTESFGSFKAVYDLMHQSHAKFPKLTFHLPELNIQLSIAGPKSKVPGVINVTDGRPFGENMWFGRVMEDGTWELNGRLQDQHQEELETVRKLLRKLAKDPAGTAAEIGKASGMCIFCNSHLEAGVSTAVGYGPVCAKKWGMPWNKGAAEAAKHSH